LEDLTKLKDVGQVIATRTLHVLGSPQERLTVKIGFPRAVSDGNDFFCPIQIVGDGEDRVFAAMGVDSLQALDLALKSVATRVDSLNRSLNGRLRWFEDQEILGFTLINGTSI
jgi:hypothetical protein